MCNRCKRPSILKEHAANEYQCTCRQRPKALKLRIASGPKLFRSLNLKRPVGLEIELSVPGDMQSITRHSPVGIQWVHDGSITPGGQELVTNPMCGELLLGGITYLSDAFRRYGCEVDATCGYHVHVGADDFSALELRRLLLLYHRFEDLFYEIVAPGRDKPKRNPRGELKCYCARLPWRAAWYTALAQLVRPADIRRYLVESLYPNRVLTRKAGVPVHIDMPGARRHKYEACRYFGLNLHTWFERGTVEFRHHEGTMDRAKLLGWALWCGWFTEFASCLNDRQVQRIITLPQLLYEEYLTGRGRMGMPSGVVAYVQQQREERSQARAQVAAAAAAAVAAQPPAALRPTTV